MKLKATVSNARAEVVIDGQNTQLKSCNKYVWRDEKAAFVIKGVGVDIYPSLKEGDSPTLTGRVSAS